MRIFTTAAAVLVLVSLVFLTTQVTHAPPSAFGNALRQLRGAGAMSYVRTIAIEGQPRLVRTKTLVSEDGRMRTEQGFSSTVFDSSGRVRITLIDDTNTAIVSDPSPLPALVAGHKPFSQWLEMLREIGDKPDKALETKEIDGKPAKGYVATRANLTFTLWVDEASGDPVLVEYDSNVNGKPAHITMRDFRFNEAFPESFFSFDVPEGYKIYGQPADGKPITMKGLEGAWSHKGFWTSVASTQDGRRIYTLKTPGEVVELDSQGNTVGTTLIGGNRGMSLRVARLAGNDVAFLTFGFPGENAVRAFQADGTELWSFAEADAVNDVCAADLNGDGLDEIAISYNASTGIRVLNHSGELLWKDTRFGNVWHLTAGVFEKGGQRQVATSANSKIHVYEADGQDLQDLSPGFHAHLVRTWRREGDHPDAVLIAGTDAGRFKLAALTLPGKIEWSIELPARAQRAAAAGQRPWLAISLGDGSVRVIDLVTTKEIARVGGHGGNADVAWLEVGDGEPQLFVTDSKSLASYRVTPSPDVAPADATPDE